MSLSLRWALNGLGIALAAWIIPGIAYDDNRALIIVVIVLGLLNAFLKPLLVFFALPFVVVTLGFGILLINAVLFLFAAHLVPGFHVDGFMAAFFGALTVSLLNLVLGRAVGDTAVTTRRGRGPRGPRGGGDVIDI